MAEVEKTFREGGRPIRSAFFVKRTLLCFAVAALIVVLSVSCYLFLIDEIVALEALLFVIAVFVPVFIASTFVKSSLLQILVGISCVTQLVSVPVFVVNKDTYNPSGWRAVRDFSFTFSEIVAVYLLLAFFLLIVVCAVALLIKMCNLPPLPQVGEKHRRTCSSKRRENTGCYLLVLIVVVIVMIPFNFWTFSQGISLTGVEPPRLPFKLSGIIHYTTSYFVSFALAAVYAKTTRSYLPAIILISYAVILGCCHVSKGTLFYALVPVIYCAVLDRRYLLASISGFVCLVAVQMITLLRGLVYVVQSGKSGADTADGLLRMGGKLLDSNVDYSAGAMVFADMVNRIESAQEIILGSKFNVDVIGGFLGALLGFNYKNWNIYDIDAYNFEYRGLLLPEGFGFGAGGMLAKALMFTHSHPFYITVFALNVALFVFLGEILTRIISRKYGKRAYYYIAGGLYIFIFYTDPGSTVFWGMTTLLLALTFTNFHSFKRVLTSKSVEATHLKAQV